MLVSEQVESKALDLLGQIELIHELVEMECTQQCGSWKEDLPSNSPAIGGSYGGVFHKSLSLGASDQWFIVRGLSFHPIWEPRLCPYWISLCPWLWFLATEDYWLVLRAYLAAD